MAESEKKSTDPSSFSFGFRFGFVLKKYSITASSPGFGASPLARTISVQYRLPARYASMALSSTPLLTPSSFNVLFISGGVSSAPPVEGG